MNITVGTQFEVTKTVTQEMLAINVGSGDVSVYATPMMISLMEEASAKCLAQFLENDMTSVGVSISTSHLCATPQGMQVRAVATITEVDNRKISFKVEAFDEVDLIGECTHKRFILNRDKFNEKAMQKLKL